LIEGHFLINGARDAQFPYQAQGPIRQVHERRGGNVKEYELRKLTLILTSEEVESFRLKPYPNQLYELTISDGNLSFKEI
jgi:hypothetical protein